jgi:hypothetical protein
MQYLEENDGLVVLLVARTVEQRNLSLSNLLPQQDERLADSLQLRAGTRSRGRSSGAT